MIDYSIKADKGKYRPTLVPLKLVEAVARVRGFGVSKYGDSDSWKRVETQRYRDAMYRHLLRYMADPYGLDDESGLPHLWHLAANAAFLIDLEWEEEGCFVQKQSASPTKQAGAAQSLTENLTKRIARFISRSK